MTRPYRKSRRAELEEETRLRITQALVDLHGSIGPARTTIRAVAARAGVQRATVYRHFPDEPSLYAACSSHWAAQNPFPDPAEWMRVPDLARRARTAIGELYRFYARNEQLLANIFRDESLVDALVPSLDAFRGYLDVASDAVVRGHVRGARRKLLRAAVAHALSFSTWSSLTRDNQLSHESAVTLMTGMIERAASGYNRARRRR